jgi:pentapeptide MXKDX repeat protein
VAKLVRPGRQYPFFGKRRPETQIPAKGANFFDPPVTIAIFGPSIPVAAGVAVETGFKKDEQSMTISSRIALGISAAAVSLSLAFAPVAFAADDMKKDDGMKKDSMSKDGMKKDDGMMKKDDGMKKDSMSKDSMKKDK